MANSIVPRITELANPFTEDLDQGGACAILRRLRQVDSQLFSGWLEHEALLDTAMLERIALVTRRAAEVLAITGPRVVVFSGCGTSGRVAWLCARALNQLQQLVTPGAQPCFKYLVAGGDEALIISKELPEDDPHLGARELAMALAGSGRSMFVGITCGLSAPYVAGQVDYAMTVPSCTAILIGFNPVALARNAPIEGWTKTCFEVFSALNSRATAEAASIATSGDESAWTSAVLNPIVGPEAVTGSSRMKGGSMTKILLELVFGRAILGPAAPSVDSTLLGYQLAYREAYRPLQSLGALVQMAGNCLCKPDGHLYFVGAGSLGLVGLMDTTEMVDTYGARLDECRAFVQHGWDAFANNEGDLSHLGPLFQLSWDNFQFDG